MELRLAVWTLGLLIGQATLAQTPGSVLRFERLGPADGLSQSSVLALHQDRLGFLWLGTQDGLNRYDGTQVRVFRHDPLDPASMPTSYVQTIAETRDGALWLGTWGGGLSRLDPATETFTHFRHDPEDDSSLPDDVVTAILEDRAGRLWVGTGGGLARLDRATGRFRRTKGLPDPFVWSLAEAPDGALWVGFYRAGLARWNPTTGRARFYRHDPSRRDGLPSDETVTVRFAQGGTLWVGTGAGVARLEPTSGRATPVRPGAGGACGTLVYGLAEGTDGVLWVATGDGGLCRVEPATGRAEAFRHAPADPTSLPRDVVRAVFVDRTGVLWVGTDGGGAARFTGASERFGLVRAGATRGGRCRTRTSGPSRKRRTGRSTWEPTGVGWPGCLAVRTPSPRTGTGQATLPAWRLMSSWPCARHATGRCGRARSGPGCPASTLRRAASRRSRPPAGPTQVRQAAS